MKISPLTLRPMTLNAEARVGMAEDKLAILVHSTDSLRCLRTPSRSDLLFHQVFPYCLFNAFLRIGLTFLHPRYLKDIAISNQSHVFVTSIVSFLLVSHVEIAQRNYMTARNALSDMCRAVRHGVQNACVFS